MRLLQRKANPIVRRRARSAASRRGVIMIMVVVVLVLMAVIAAAYLTVVRVDRMANRQLTDNIDLVLAAILSEINRELAWDIAYVHPEQSATPGTLSDFNHIQFGQVTPGSPPVGWRRNEAYDYPNRGLGDLGENDDRWLGLFEPVGTSWTQVSDVGRLVGKAVQYHDHPGGTVADPLPGHFVQFSTTATTPPAKYVGALAVPMSDASALNATNAAADADADGFLDSRWKSAPIDQIAGVRYYYGVRILDHGGMINANVALRPGGERFWFPTDMDLAAGMGLASGDANVSKWIAYRLGTVPQGTPSSRLTYWELGPGGGFSAPTQGENTPDNETELRYRWGLNSDTVARIEYDGPTNYLRIPLNADATVSKWPSATAHQGAPWRRHLTTTMNGTSDVAGATWGAKGASLVQLPQMFGPGPGAGSSARQQLIQLLIKDPDMPFYNGTPPSAVPPATFQPASASGRATRPWQSTGNVQSDAANAAAQYVAALVDYFDGDYTASTDDIGNPVTGDLQPDADSTITKIRIDVDGSFVPPSTNPEVAVRYGMEALPFLTEVHVYGTYKIVEVTANDDDMDPGTPDVYDIKWEVLTPGGAPSQDKAPVSIALEMINPFHSRVRNLDDIRVVWDADGDGMITDTEAGTSYRVLGDLLPGNSDNWIQPRETIVLRHLNDGEGGDARAKLNYPDPGAARHGTIPTEIAFAPDPAAIPDPTTGLIPVGQVMFALQVRAVDSEGNEEWITYSRIHKRDTMQMLAKWDGSKWGFEKTGVQEPAGGPPVVDSISYIQRGALCVADGLNPIAVICLEGAGLNEYTEVTDNQTEPSAEPRPIDQNIDKVGDLAKAPAAAVGPFAADNTYAYAFDDVALRYPTDLFRPMWVGPWKDGGTTYTYAEMFRDTQAELDSAPPAPAAVDDVLQKRMMTWAGEKIEPHGSPDRTLYRGQVLMDRVVAMRSGTPIPGRLNLNTVPQRVFLGAMSAFPVSPAAIWTEVKSFREGGSVNRPGEEGISSLGELLDMNSLKAGGTPPAFDGGGMSIATGGTSTNGQMKPSITTRDDDIRAAGYLMNLSSVRSDFFTAYIVIRGHRTDFLNPEETGQYIAILDRSNVRNASATPTLVSLYRVK